MANSLLKTRAMPSREELQSLGVESDLLANAKWVASGCYVWLGGRREGYGSLKVNGVTYLAHRLAHTLWNGEIPQGMLVLHSCDNRSCINPAHLSVGTIADNIADMDAKGRRATRAKSGRAKLTEEQVRYIREKFKPRVYTLQMLADELGICLRQVHMIARNKSWKE